MGFSNLIGSLVGFPRTMVYFHEILLSQEPLALVNEITQPHGFPYGPLVFPQVIGYRTLLHSTDHLLPVGHFFPSSTIMHSSELGFQLAVNRRLRPLQRSHQLSIHSTRERSQLWSLSTHYQSTNNQYLA